MSSPLTWDLGLSIPERPIPKFVRDLHRVRVLDWTFSRAADYDITNDWTQTLTGTGAQTRVVPSLSLSSPCLRLTSAAANDGAVAVHNSKFIQMPTATEGRAFYLAFDFGIEPATTNMDFVLGIFSGTPAQAFDPTAKTVMSAGAGILIRRTASSNLWEVFYKTASGTTQTLGSLTLTPVTTTFFRAGFLCLTDPAASASNNLALGRVVPFIGQLSNLNLLAGGDEQSELPDAAFILGTNGLNLDRTNANHTDGAGTQAAICMGVAGAGAGTRNLDIRRILYVDNWRR